jgi:hypothetical protein
MATTGALSDFVETAIAKQYFQNTAPATPPTSLYVALFTVAPSDGGGGTEVSASGTAYARQAVSTGTSGTGAGSGWSVAAGVVTNANDITFPVCTGSWGTIVSVGVFDASSSGNLIFRADLTASVPITTAGVDQFKLPAGALSLTID